MNYSLILTTQTGGDELKRLFCLATGFLSRYRTVCHQDTKARKKINLNFVSLCLCGGFLFLAASSAFAADLVLPRLDVGVTPAQSPQEVALSVQILILLTILTLAPSLMIMVTAFVRVSIIFAFMKQALNAQGMPPNQVIMGLALFVTFYIMAPTISEINKNAYQPYIKGELNFEEGLSEAAKPIRKFMFRQTREKDIDLFMSLSKLPQPKNRDDVPTYTLIPAFMISEIMTAFQMGILLFVPFLVIDMVVASVLMSMGMIMLPPVMVSMPFKILLFVMVDGWHLLTKSVILSFH